MIPNLSASFGATNGDLESALTAKTNPIFANSFAVGAGASATSSPSVSDGGGLGGLPPEYLLIGGAAVVALVLVVTLRK